MLRLRASTTAAMHLFSFSRRRSLCALAAAILVCAVGGTVQAQQVQCFPLEFFYDSSVDDAAELRAALEQFAERRTGLKLHFRDVHENEDVDKRIDQLAKYFRLQEVKLPAMYGLKYVLVDLKSPDDLRSRLDKVLTLTAYIRNGCPHCAAAKSFFAKYGRRYPALKIVYREVITDASARREMDDVVRRYRKQAASLPVVHFCNDLSIGFDTESTTGRRILQKLDYWSKACPVEKKKRE